MSSTNTNNTTAADAADTDTTNFQSELAADRNGYFARLADRVFGSDGFLGTFADEQRLERLDGCKALEGDWDHCTKIQRRLEEVERARLEKEQGSGSGGGGFWGRRKNKGAAAGAVGTDEQADDAMDTSYVPSQSATKTRIARFYDWGEPDGDAAEAPGDGGAVVPATSASCHRETHSVWACRALAVGCADHLPPLRKCLQRTGTVATHYEGNTAGGDTDDAFSNDSADECILEQQALAQCVNIKLEELDKRFRDRQRLTKRRMFFCKNCCLQLKMHTPTFISI